MKMEDLLSNRLNNENVIYDFDDLTRDELAVYVNSEIYGEENLSDEEMQLLESGTAKIIERPGKPREYDEYPNPYTPGKDDPEAWLKSYIAWQQGKK